MIDITRAEAIEGWMSRGELRWLAEQAQQHHVIVEIGSYRGRSTRALADHTPGFVVAIDPHIYRMPGKADVAQRFSENLADHLAARKVRHVACASEACLPDLGAALGIHRPDMVFIDGCHDYAAVVADIQLAAHLLTPGGLLCGHDYTHRGLPGVRAAVDQLGRPIFTQESIWWTLQ